MNEKYEFSYFFLNIFQISAQMKMMAENPKTRERSAMFNGCVRKIVFMNGT